MQVVGVDPSLTSTGVALVSGTGVTSGVVTSSGRRGDALPARDARLTGLVAGVMEWVPPGSLVVVEGPSFASVGGSSWDRAGLWHRLVHAFHGAGCGVAVVAPTTRAKWATGSGKADKAAVAAAVARMVPTVELGSSDAADAVALALMGAQAVGLRPDTAARMACLLKAEWPGEVVGGLLRPFERSA